jgi:hypothetical protein
MRAVDRADDEPQTAWHGLHCGNLACLATLKMSI